MRKIAVMFALVLALFAFGCGEEGNDPAPADSTGENGGNVDSIETGNGIDISSLEYTMPEVGQWIAYGVEGQEKSFKLAIVAEEDYQGAACLWYQIEVDSEAVAQVLIDPALLQAVIDLSGSYMDEFIADPVAYVTENMPENGNFMENEETIANMMTFLRSIKQIKINDGQQLMLLDLAGVPELVEQMIAENPDMISENMEINPTDSLEYQQLLTDLENAEFGIEEVTVEGLNCTQFTATNPEKGTIQIIISAELPILPVMDALVTPNDPAEVPSHVMVTGFGFEGAENLMTQVPDQVVPVAMMLQGMLSQTQPQPE
jgi:hypothetical protein